MPIANKRYISAIPFLDQREINKSVIDIQNEDDFLDIMNICGRYEETSMFEYHNFVNEPLFKVGTGTAVSTNGTASLGVTSADSIGYARLWDTVLFNDGGQGIITNIAGNVLTVQSVDGTNITVATPPYKFSIISNAQTERSSAPEPHTYKWTKYQNKIQIFRESDEITDVQKASKLEVEFNGQPYMLVVNHAQKVQRLRGMVSAQCIAGKMSSFSFSDAAPSINDGTPLGGNTFQTTRGLDAYSREGIVDALNTTGTVVMADLRDLVGRMVANKCPNSYMMWHGTESGAIYDEFLKNLGTSGVTSARMNIDGKEVDMEVEKFNYAGFKFQKKRLPILDHPQLFNFAGGSSISKNIYFVPTDSVKTQLGKGLAPRIRMRYVPQPLEGGTGDKIYREVHQGLLAPVPVGRTANWTTDWITYQGLECLGTQHFAVQRVVI